MLALSDAQLAALFNPGGEGEGRGFGEGKGQQEASEDEKSQKQPAITPTTTKTTTPPIPPPLFPRPVPVLATIFFTLNELFATSVPRTTGLLLRLTDVLPPGAVLLVVDSPGSYSVVSLGAGATSAASTGTSNKNAGTSNNKKNTVTRTDASSSSPSSSSSSPSYRPRPHPHHRTYPMRFLLDHALLRVAGPACWEPIVAEEAVWFRREAGKLRYVAGDGVGLEDMRFQIWGYRRR